MNDAFINIASQITPDSQRVADLDFDDVALYDFVKSKSGNQSFQIPPITEAQMLDLIKKIPSSKAPVKTQATIDQFLYYLFFRRSLNVTLQHLSVDTCTAMICYTTSSQLSVQIILRKRHWLN